MKTRKIEEKDSITYIIEQGSRTFKFVEYKEDVWADRKRHPKQTKPIYKKGETDFFIFMDNIDLPFAPPLAYWSQIKNIKTLKRAKEYIRNREYL